MLTSLAGRSEASAARAREAGLKAVGDDDIATADIVLSILPPGDAEALAQRLAPALTRSNRKPAYVDCNAINPATVERVAAIVGDTGAPFVDGAIIGPPPRDDVRTVFYVSGPEAARVAVLRDYGLDVRVLEGPLSAASSLKMSYAGITKGFTALGAAMMLAAERGGATAALQRELRREPAGAARLARRQRARHVWQGLSLGRGDGGGRGLRRAGRAARDMLLGSAALYERLAHDVVGDKHETGTLTAFLTEKK